MKMAQVRAIIESRIRCLVPDGMEVGLVLLLLLRTEPLLAKTPTFVDLASSPFSEGLVGLGSGDSPFVVEVVDEHFEVAPTVVVDAMGSKVSLFNPELKPWREELLTELP